ncbi:aminopeptidase N [Shewanella maritima]|uniref:aminopeptidase N n=1 Tax=Shewanella maritima TaxID=2520507 RepID=UPI003736CD07
MGCTATTQDPQARDGSSNITQAQAMSRSAVVSNVAYQLAFTLTGDTEFSATTIVNFDLASTSAPLTLDLNQARVDSFIINGKRIYPNYNGAYFTLNPGLLVTGSNQIEISFSREHSTNGEGLHRFVDPVDDQVYLYSHFEPAAAQQIFAVFDQPDLKATFEISVEAPKDWHVISATREQRIEQGDEHNTWFFPTTPKLSPYNFSLHAGPYHVWQDDSGKYPLRLFARQSVAKQVTPEDWFSFTHQGLAFFEHYFDIEYPFKKYDQLLVPDFLYGAMENAAAITFAEGAFLHKAEMTAAQKESLAGVIMHEMAHQWFGNLVTMRWWNGLWLNESFASFMGTLATSEATEFSHAWRTFYARGKQRAYHQDNLVTTHPIEVPVPTSHNAFDNIDAITYHKGASVLNQLRHLLGEDVFRQGVRDYLKQYSYQNATLDNFIASLANASNRDLTQWTQEWLYQAGVNTIKAEYVCGNGRISEFRLLQSINNDQYPVLREQRVQLGLFFQHSLGVYKSRKVAVTYQGESTEVPQLIGNVCPDLVYPNLDDWGFVKVELDKRSFETAKQQLSRVEDPLLRSMLWQSMWDSVVDGRTGIEQFINVALINAPKEHDYTILGQVIGNLYRAQASLNLMAPSHQQYAAQVSRALGQMSLRMTMQNRDNSDFQRRWFDAYTRFAQDPSSLAHLNDILSGKAKIKGLEVHQDIRWSLIKQLNRYAYSGSKQLIEAELLRDNSDAGQKAAIAAEVIRPDPAIKRQWLHAIEHDNSLAFSKKRVAMNAMYPAEQKRLSQQTAQQRLNNIGQYDQLGAVFMRAFNRSMLPQACSAESIEALTAIINDADNLSAMTVRALLETRQQEYRCVQMKSLTQP